VYSLKYLHHFDVFYTYGAATIDFIQFLSLLQSFIIIITVYPVRIALLVLLRLASRAKNHETVPHYIHRRNKYHKLNGRGKAAYHQLPKCMQPAPYTTFQFFMHSVSVPHYCKHTLSQSIGGKF
jgi:hypothetical protein